MEMEKGLKEIYDGVKKLITISERIEENTKDIEGIKGDIVKIRKRIDVIEERLHSLESGQREIGVDIQTIKEKMELKDEIYALKERLTLLEGAKAQSKT
jgi:chromosome segregation ATPase